MSAPAQPLTDAQKAEALTRLLLDVEQRVQTEDAAEQAKTA
jgi:hypothetical protein